MVFILLWFRSKMPPTQYLIWSEVSFWNVTGSVGLLYSSVDSPLMSSYLNLLGTRGCPTGGGQSLGAWVWRVYLSLVLSFFLNLFLFNCCNGFSNVPQVHFCTIPFLPQNQSTTDLWNVSRNKFLLLEMCRTEYFS